MIKSVIKLWSVWLNRDFPQQKGDVTLRFLQQKFVYAIFR